MNAECSQFRDVLSEYLEGELAAPSRQALEAHLTGCAECRDELEALRHTVGALAGLPRQQAPTGFADGVTDRLRTRVRPVLRPGGERRTILALWTRVLPVAALLLVVVGLVLTVHRNGLFQAPESASRLAMDRPRQMEVALSTPQAEAEVARGAVRLDEAPEGVARERAGWIRAAPDELRPSALPAEETTVEFLREPMRAAAEMGELAKALPAPAVAPESVVGYGMDNGRVQPPLKEVTARGAAPAEARPGQPPALSWHAVRGVGGRLADAEAKKDQRVLFVQGPLDRRAVAPAPVQQVLTVMADDPAELARLAVGVANESGVAATLSLPDERTGGGLDLYLAVPPAQYERLLQQLAMLAPPSRQDLSNSLGVSGAFFDAMVANYRAYQRASREELKAPDASAAAAAAGRTALVRRMEAALEERDAERIAGDHLDMAGVTDMPVEPVNLLVRIQRPVPVAAEAEAARAKVGAASLEARAAEAEAEK